MLLISRPWPQYDFKHARVTATHTQMEVSDDAEYSFIVGRIMQYSKIYFLSISRCCEATKWTYVGNFGSNPTNITGSIPNLDLSIRVADQSTQALFGHQSPEY